MMHWEYCQSRDFGALAALGRQGWELVAALPAPAGGEAIFYLKRPAPNLRERVTADQKQRYYAQLGIRAAEAGSPP